MSFNLGFLTDLVTMGKDISSLMKGDGTGFMSKALQSFTTQKDKSGLAVPGKARGVLENWPKPTVGGVSVGYQLSLIHI